MTEPLFFDTDCLSSFLWVDEENILSKLFKERIVIPKEVYEELSHPAVNRVKHLKAQLDAMINGKEASIETIMVVTESYKLFRKLINNPDPGHVIIGKGEAAAITPRKEYRGILASNNLRDISQYVEEYSLVNFKTEDILAMALDASFITETQGNAIWLNMLRRRRKLGYPTFSDYLNNSNPLC